MTNLIGQISTFLVIIVIAFFALNYLLVKLQTRRDHDTPDTIPTEQRNLWLSHHGFNKLTKFYPGRSFSDLNAHLNDTWVTRSEFAPYFHNKSAPYSSKHKNISPHGFRSIGREQAEWPPEPGACNIFVYGGSTTLGSGLLDNETVPAQLQSLLRDRASPRKINIYNFGSPSHFSTQERVYFEHHVMSGHCPDIAVFIDGLNDTYFWTGEPANTEWYRNVSNMVSDRSWRRDFRYHAREAARRLPLCAQLVERLSPTEPPSAWWESHISDEDAGDIIKINAVITRYLRNKKIIEAVSTQFDIKTLFVWQPVPFFQYPNIEQTEQAFGGAVGAHKRSKYLYPIMNDFVGMQPLGDNFLWAAESFAGAGNEPMYLDHVHYSANGARLFAAEIERKLSSIIGQQGISS